MFEAALGNRPKGSLGTGAVVSIALHALLGLGYLAYEASGAGKAETEAPEVKFMKAPPAPPPPPPPPPPAGSTKPKQTPKTTKKTVVPREIPKEISKETPAPEPDEPAAAEEPGGKEGGVVGGVEGGVVGGVVGGTGTGPVDQGPPKVVPSFVIDRQRIAYPDPKLPDHLATRYAGQSVRGNYRICIGVDGNVVSVTVISGIGGADDSITEHVKSTWKYKPQPVPVCTVRTFVFNVR